MLLQFLACLPLPLRAACAQEAFDDQIAGTSCVHFGIFIGKTDLYDSSNEEGARLIKRQSCMQLAGQRHDDVHLQPQILSHRVVSALGVERFNTDGSRSILNC